MAKVVLGLVALLVAGIAQAPCLAQDSPPEQPVSSLPQTLLEAEVSIVLPSAPLPEILAEIARQLGVRWSGYLSSSPPVLGVWYQGPFGPLASVVANETEGQWAWAEGMLFFRMRVPSPTEEYLRGVQSALEKSRLIAEFCASLTPEQMQKANQDWYLHKSRVWGPNEGPGLLFEELDARQKQIVEALWAWAHGRYRLPAEQVPLTSVKYIGWGRIQPTGDLMTSVTLEVRLPRPGMHPYHLVYTYDQPCPPGVVLPEHFFQFGIAPEEREQPGPEA